jgi:hypothetical protein
MRAATRERMIRIMAAAGLVVREVAASRAVAPLCFV